MIRCAYRRYCRRLRERFLRRVRKLGLEAVVANESNPSLNPASDRVPGSSSVLTWTKSSLSAVTSPAHVASMRCS